ncbi:thiolase domain-containing protein [Natronorubrum daqingense]|uniref:Acetyl-CoA C-acetyltransferase n=1 Tax=Natronorubrum daqingense TaxID=588898 RepID=A0A1N7D2F8_9EURY|nr:thiolase domain-containing protein [Natronorubrum daqingense]APX97173.1 acetyl-CoA acetyltransferase [Natronorubrum daqingense]SIR69960.1 acetyl-CoA C-acetyltransferase [Natronorubrum daqingense]
MATQSPVYIAGAYEHPTREAPEKSTMQLHAEVARGALEDANLEKDSIDAYFTAGMPEYESGLTPLIMADYLGLDVSYADTTDFGGSSYISHVGHAVAAIRNGTCDVALITLAGRPRSRGQATGSGAREIRTTQDSFERIYGATNIGMYGMAAQRHMHEYGTTPEQLAEIRVAASHHAQFNEHAMYQDPVTVDDVVSSRVVADPLHLLDCCVISDGGGALLVVSEDVRSRLEHECVEVLGHGESIGHHQAGRIDLTRTAARESGSRAFDEAGLDPTDVDYASIYDSFTITVLEAIEDLGFCAKGDGGSFVEGGALKAPNGELPFNTDGGGLCSNHPANRGGMTKVIEAVRQLRGDANDEVQVDADIALAHGTGGSIGTRHGAATVVLGGEDR